MAIFKTDFCGREFSVEVDKFAELSNGAAMVRYGDTSLLVTANSSKRPKDGIDFFPLTVDFEERFYAVGKIPGGYIKREGRPSERAVLTSRLIDRPIRPLFPKGFRNDVQVVASVYALEHDNDPAVVAINGASIALSISDIPFEGPIGAVSVGLVDGTIVINPTVEERNNSVLSLMVAGTKEAVMMVEAGAKEISEVEMLDAIMAGHDEIKKIIAFQEEVIAAVGKEKATYPIFEIDAELQADAKAFLKDEMRIACGVYEKLARQEAIDSLEDRFLAALTEKYPDNKKHLVEMFDKVMKETVREMIRSEKIRPDGRAYDEVRPISCEVGLFNRIHGTGLFKRGQTQVLSNLTLGAKGDAQNIDGLGLESSKRYMHHYNFPGFSTGEAKPMRSPGRREIGHGALAERAIEPMLPDEADFPYTIRIVSEVLSSNGSSSMGSVCGSTLALLDAGVPMKRPVSGVAMGLLKQGDDYIILTDIQGLEDFYGDMDFKVAGTTAGITAIQMDIKVDGLSREILGEALQRANEGRMFILNKMLEVIDTPRTEMSPYAPRIIKMTVPVDKIRDVIGAGGKTINRIIAETNVTIDIDDTGTVLVMSANLDDAKRAITMIENLTKDVKAGEIYMAKITRLMAFGAFAEILPGKEGLIHISKMDTKRVEKVEDFCQVGDEMLVKVTEIDQQGRINLSRKDILLAENKKENTEE